MKCPHCKFHIRTTPAFVVDSRYVDGRDAIRRRRQCSHCGGRFTTYETPEPFLAPAAIDVAESSGFGRTRFAGSGAAWASRELISPAADAFRCAHCRKTYLEDPTVAPRSDGVLRCDYCAAGRIFDRNQNRLLEATI